MYCVGVALKITQFLNHMYCLLVNYFTLRLIRIILDSSVGTARKVGPDFRRKLLRF